MRSMARVQDISNPSFVKNQYRDASNLNARIRLHQEFSTNKYGWHRWLFEQFQFESSVRILELGCGSGNLWSENIDRLPPISEMILSDLSEGMLKQAQLNLWSKGRYFQFGVIDAQSIPFDDGSFDMVIASHMLYHLTDRSKGLKEIKRVMKPTGHFYASTIGCNHLKELSEIIGKFDSQLAIWGRLPSNSFTLENGASQLADDFFDISVYRYPDSLEVTDAKLLLDYIFSGRLELSDERKLELIGFVMQQFEINGGKFFITKDSGVFEASIQ